MRSDSRTRAALEPSAASTGASRRQAASLSPLDATSFEGKGEPSAAGRPVGSDAEPPSWQRVSAAGAGVDDRKAVTAPIVAAHSRFDGLVAFRGNARIDGELHGGVVCRGSLEVGPGARITGTIEVDELVLHGRLDGDAIARGRIELGATARVNGSIRAPRIALAEGCLIDGRCEMPKSHSGAPD